MLNFFSRKHQGVSLIEVLMVISIIGILSGISVSGYFYYKKNSELDLSLWQVANMLRKAKANSVSVVEDDQWGVRIEKDGVIVFRGGNFSERDASFDSVVALSGITEVSGVSQISFTKFSGLPSTSGSITLSSGLQTKNIQINAAGIISY